MDLLDRLYHKLREASSREHPAASSPSFTVGELYQQLVPYRGVRGELGILELAEYEHAILRLLAGERGYLRVEVPDVQQELKKELSSPSPILGIYRDYAAVKVELTPPADTPTVPEHPRLAPRPSPRPAETMPPTAAAATRPASGARCFACHGSLPDVPDLRFCPHCGTDQDEAPCSRCGLALEPGWHFCIRCGSPREAGPGTG